MLQNIYTTALEQTGIISLPDATSEECGDSVVECLRGCGVKPHSRHCIVSLIKTLYPLLSTASTQEDSS